MGWRCARSHYINDASHPIQTCIQTHPTLRDACCRLSNQTILGCDERTWTSLLCVVCHTHSIRLPTVRIFQFYFISIFFFPFGIICKAHKQCQVMFHIYRDQSTEHRECAPPPSSSVQQLNEPVNWMHCSRSVSKQFDGSKSQRIHDGRVYCAVYTYMSVWLTEYIERCRCAERKHSTSFSFVRFDAN